MLFSEHASERVTRSTFDLQMGKAEELLNRDGYESGIAYAFSLSWKGLASLIKHPCV